MGYGTKLKELLKSKNITIKDLSIASGISINTLYSITKRDSNNVDTAILIRIANALNIDITELIDSDGCNPLNDFEILTAYDKQQQELKKIISINLNYLLGSNLLTIPELSENIKIDENLVKEWVFGNSIPKPNEQKVIEDYFNIPTDSLIKSVISYKYTKESNKIENLFKNLSKEQIHELINLIDKK